MKTVNLNLPPETLSGSLPQKLSARLLDWYDKNHRTLPWRTSPQARKAGEKPDPYHVWLSEIMLQQTTVATVKGYFHKFITHWPNIHSLSIASLEDVLKMWAGLGYYSRARNLKTTADTIASLHHGIFPKQYQDLRALPGIGVYSAAAIMAIAYDKPYAVVDGNVERIIARLLAIETPKPALRSIVHTQVEILTPPSRAGDFAQSMMDLGAIICRPTRPFCSLCPWEDNCEAAKRGEATNFPRKRPKTPKPLRTGIAFVLRSTKGCIFLQKRPSQGLLSLMSEVPNHFGENISKQAVELAPCEGSWHYQGDIVHIFTHFRLEMSVYLLTAVDEKTHVNGWWVHEKALDGEALPSLMKKVLMMVCPDAFRK